MTINFEDAKRKQTFTFNNYSYVKINNEISLNDNNVLNLNNNKLEHFDWFTKIEIDN